MGPPIPNPPRDWYLPLAAHLKGAYLRYSFTLGTAAEVDFLWEELGLKQGMRILDVGCGPGRHAVEFAQRGVDVVGIDISPEFLGVARERAKEAGVSVSFFEMDAHLLPFEEEFDGALTLCEGAFGLGLDDLTILKGMARALVAGGGLAAGAINVFYVLEHMADSGEFDPTAMIYKESSAVVGDDGSESSFEMWNSCYTPRELEWLANGAGLDPKAVYGISPGVYDRARPTPDHPELLLVARKPQST